MSIGWNQFYNITVQLFYIAILYKAKESCVIYKKKYHNNFTICLCAYLCNTSDKSLPSTVYYRDPMQVCLLATNHTRRSLQNALYTFVCRNICFTVIDITARNVCGSVIFNLSLHRKYFQACRFFI